MNEPNIEFVDAFDNLVDSQEFSPMGRGRGHRGARTVIGRVLKDGAKVPLFLGQTLIDSLRDLGYNSTTSALCEHVDNAIQVGRRPRCVSTFIKRVRGVVIGSTAS